MADRSSDSSPGWTRLSPSNVMRCQPMRAQGLDFGLCGWVLPRTTRTKAPKLDQRAHGRVKRPATVAREFERGAQHLAQWRRQQLTRADLGSVEAREVESGSQ